MRLAVSKVVTLSTAYQDLATLLGLPADRRYSAMILQNDDGNPAGNGNTDIIRFGTKADSDAPTPVTDLAGIRLGQALPISLERDNDLLINPSAIYVLSATDAQKLMVWLFA